MKTLILLAAASAAAQTFEVKPKVFENRQPKAAGIIRVTIGHQPPSVLRALSSEQLPEGLGLYSVVRCVSSGALAPELIPSGLVAQGLGREGLAVVDRQLAQLAVERSRSKALGFLLPIAEAIGPVGLSVFGWLASDSGVRLTPWRATIATGVIFAFQEIAKQIGGARQRTRRPLTDVGIPWLSDEKAAPLVPPGECAPAALTMATYRRRQKEVMEVEIHK